VARSCGVARCGRALRLKVNVVGWNVARSCGVARCGRAGLLPGEGEVVSPEVALWHGVAVLPFCFDMAGNLWEMCWGCFGGSCVWGCVWVMEA